MKSGCVYEFGPYRQDTVARLLTRQGALVAITPKAFDALLYLVSNAGRTVTRDEIIQAVWQDTFVEEGNLNYNVSQIRKILGEYQPGVPYIQTLPKQGYRFIAKVDQVDEAAQPAGSKRPLRMPGAVALIATAIAVSTWFLLRLRDTATQRTPGLIRLTADSGLTMTPALSPDGKLITYASDRGGEGNLDIWLQQVGGGAPIRLTHDSGDDSAPSFSPDGRRIAFRSERKGGGIYVISSLGGEAARIAPLGRRPRYSPDGQWIAYWIGTEAIGIKQSNFVGPGTAKMYIVPSTGGSPREIRPDFAAAAYPVWTPDGKHLLFLGNRDPNVLSEPDDSLAPGAASVDWWVTPIEGGAAVATGANAVFRELGMPSVSQGPDAWTEDGAGVLTSAAQADTQNVWRIPISAGNWKVSGAARRLTFGTSIDLQPSAAAGGQVAFSSLSGTLDVWSLPLDPDRAKPAGSLDRLTADAFDHMFPSASPDGTKITYSSRRSGTRDIWVKDLATGKETVVSTRPASAFGSVFSADGGLVAYRAVEAQKSIVYVVSLADGSHQRVPEGCLSTVGWVSDGKQFLCALAAPSRISIIDVASKKATELVTHATWRLWNPRVSPDDRWVTFNATTAGRSQIFVAPFRKKGLIPESEWITITNDVWDDKPRWSPDGNTLYFLSERDRFRCIWAQRLDRSKRPVGEAIPMFHAHESRRSLLNMQIGALDISVARDRIVFNMGDLTGNIWMMNLSQQR